MLKSFDAFVGCLRLKGNMESRVFAPKCPIRAVPAHKRYHRKNREKVSPEKTRCKSLTHNGLCSGRYWARTNDLHDVNVAL